MAMEFIKEPLRINQIVGDDSLQFSVQGDLIIPDVKPDLLGVLSIDSDMVINERDVLTDKIVLGGVVNFNIIYLAKDEERPVRSLNASVSFKEPVEIPGVRPGMDIEISGDILNSEFEILNERKIMVEAIAQITASASERVEANLIADTLEEDDIQKQKEMINVCQYVGNSEESFNVKEEFELPDDLPPIFEVLKTEARISKETKISDNKVIVHGDIDVKMLYSADDESKSLNVVEHNIPYTQFLDILGVDENAVCDTNAKLNDVNVSAEENENGETRIIKYKISGEVGAKAYLSDQKEIITDMYSPNAKIDVNFQDINANHMVKEIENDIAVKEKIQLPENEQVKNINGMFCKPQIMDVKVQDERIMLNGAVEILLLYTVGDENTPSSFKYEVPFANTIDIKEAKPEMTCKVKAKSAYGTCGLDFDGEVEARISLKTETKLYNNMALKTIEKAEYSEIDPEELESKPSLTIYFVQPEDTLWKIGKKFNVPLEQLEKINSIQNNEQMLAGQQVLIPKKYVKKYYIKK